MLTTMTLVEDACGSVPCLSAADDGASARGRHPTFGGIYDEITCFTDQMFLSFSRAPISYYSLGGVEGIWGIAGRRIRGLRDTP
jgi:hypothetical protein